MYIVSSRYLSDLAIHISRFFFILVQIFHGIALYWMLKYKIGITDVETHKLIDDPIIDISLNQQSGVLAIASVNANIALKNIYLQGRSLSITTMQMSLEYITKIEWLTNYKLIAAGAGGFLHYFDIMNVHSDMFPVDNSSVAAMKIRENFVYTGSIDGNVNLWDIRTYKSVLSIQHVYRRQKQPLLDLEAVGNYMYDTTLYNGLVWVWDLRNPKKHVNRIKTDTSQSHIEHVMGNLYTVNAKGVLRMSKTLEMHESFHTCEEQQHQAKRQAIFSPRYNSLIWTDGRCVHLADIDDQQKECRRAFEGVCGVEQYTTNRVIAFSGSGDGQILTIGPFGCEAEFDGE